MPEPTTTPASTEEAPSTQLSDAPIKPIIGIIYPPPEIRNIVDKTASFVARIGPEFETRIRQNEVNNPKFNFLSPEDPYHAYYRHKVMEFKEGKAIEPSAAKTPGLGLAPVEKEKPAQPAVEPTVVLKDPPPEFEFIADPPSISAFDLDVVKLTAQFVARNGRQFLTNLIQREQKNYQFDFLRPQHSLFSYFTRLVEQYTKVMIPPKDLLAKLRTDAADPHAVLSAVNYRVEWQKYQERERAKEEQALEKERVAYAQIDWHDFVIVETVDFHYGERGNFPPPTTPQEVGARVLMQERKEIEEDVEPASDAEKNEKKDMEAEEPVEAASDDDEGVDETEDMMEESDEEDESAAPQPTGRPAIAQPAVQLAPPVASAMGLPMAQAIPQPMSGIMLPPGARPPLPKQPPPPLPTAQQPPLPPAPDQVIVKAYDPKAKPSQEKPQVGDEFLVSPITGEKVPASRLQDHVRINLLDPSWKEQQQRSLEEKRHGDDVFAPGANIGASLEHFAQRRTDIFGVAETQIGRKVGEEEVEPTAPKVVWDGHTASMERVSREARKNVTIQDQIQMIHKTKGLVGDEEKDRIGTVVQQPPSNVGAPTPQVPPPPPPSGAAAQATPGQTSVPPSTTTTSAIPGPDSMGQLPPGPPLPVPPQHPPQPPQAGLPMPGPPRPMGLPPGMAVVPPPVVPMATVRPAAVPVMMAPMVRMPTAPVVAAVPVPPANPVTAFMAATRTDSPHADSDVGPPPKRAKTEDSLIPEDEFLANNPGPVTFRVQAPSIPEKPEWKLAGQILEFTLPLTDTVSVIKAKLHETLTMPAGKQKLSHEGIFIKDNNSLAHYNFTNGCLVTLQQKERGGRKK